MTAVDAAREVDAADALADAALALARRFATGATMWCVARVWPAHGRHVAVEFVHPVIVGKRALPAVHVDADALGLLARPGDVVAAVGPAGDELPPVLADARDRGLLTAWLGAGARPDAGAADHVLWSDGPAGPVAGDLVARYHLLWELTHVVFEHPGLLVDEPSPAAADTEATGFLYPFLDAEERDADALLAALADSARAKLAETAALQQATLTASADTLAAAAGAMSERLAAGGQLLTFGNGGSATDAQAAAALWRDPPRGRPLAARALVDDPAVLTALANDVGFDLVFARQVIAHGRPGDVALGYSTSGDSANVVRGCEEAARRGLLTLATAGYDGGALAASPAVDHAFVVRSASVHRIQEAQAALTADLWARVQEALGGG